MDLNHPYLIKLRTRLKLAPQYSVAYSLIAAVGFVSFCIQYGRGTSTSSGAFVLAAYATVAAHIMALACTFGDQTVDARPYVVGQAVAGIFGYCVVAAILDEVLAQSTPGAEGRLALRMLLVLLSAALTGAAVTVVFEVSKRIYR